MAEIVTGGKEFLPVATGLLAEAFKKDPTITCILSGLGEKAESYRPHFFHSILTSAALNGAVFNGIGDWKSCGVLMPPGCRMDSIGTWLRANLFGMLWTVGFQGTKKILWEFPQIKKTCKPLAFPDNKYYYIFILGTAEDGRGKGYCSAMVKHYQEIARKDGLPLYLEAGTDYSWKLYTKLGFETLHTMLLGEGAYNADGKKEVGGSGFKLRGMIWRP